MERALQREIKAWGRECLPVIDSFSVLNIKPPPR
jgi:hypothetical protein